MRALPDLPSAGPAGDDRSDDEPADLDGAAISAHLGTRMRLLRKQAGLTLNDLSERSGVSRAFLSAIERGAKSPTLPIVVRIAKGLQVTMSSLLGVERAVAEVSLQRREDRVVFRDPQSGFEREVLSPAHAGDVEIVLHRIHPGGSSGLLPAYATPTEKHVVVQEGTLTVLRDGAAYRVRSGDALAFAITGAYELRNDGDRPCVYMVVMVRSG